MSPWNPFKHRVKTSRNVRLENRELLAALEAGASGDALDSRLLYQLIHISTLLTPIAEPASLNATIPDTKFLTRNDENDRSLLAFTDYGSVQRYFPGRETNCMGLPGPDLCRVAVELDVNLILFNPGGPFGYRMSRHEFQPLAEGLALEEGGVMRTEGPTDIMIGAPSALPISRNVIEMLRSIVVAHEVTEAYWFWMRVSGGTPHLGLAVSPPDTNLILKIQTSVQNVWAQHFPPGEIFYVLPLESDDDTSDRISAMGERLC